MQIKDYVELILSSFLGIGGLIFGIGYAWGQFRQGTTQNKLDEGNDKLNTNTLLKDQIDALEGKVNRQSAEIKELTEKVRLLTNSLEEERKKFTDAILTMQGKDPAMLEFMKTGNHYMTYSMPVFDRLNKYLDKQVF